MPNLPLAWINQKLIQAYLPLNYVDTNGRAPSEGTPMPDIG